jgi:hypothetical protein
MGLTGVPALQAPETALDADQEPDAERAQQKERDSDEDQDPGGSYYFGRHGQAAFAGVPGQRLVHQHHGARILQTGVIEFGRFRIVSLSGSA